MDRRTFLRQMAAVAAGATLTRPFGAARALANVREIEDFSLSIITDEPDKTMAAVENLLQYSGLKPGNLRFDEVILPGVHMADIVLLSHNRLVNYKAQETSLARGVYELAQKLELPRQLDNPVWMNISAGQGPSQGQTANIYQKNALVGQIELTKDRHNIAVAGKRGEMVFAIRAGRVEVEHASCKHKTCVKMGGIRKPGQHIVCIPNEIRVTIAGENALGLDSLAF
ncbi:MAG: NusG domain II-containing protein [Calditrichaeota bacterium]|nr:NusG domain II-containing protein [Calditrichota bacterium]